MLRKNEKIINKKISFFNQYFRLIVFLVVIFIFFISYVFFFSPLFTEYKNFSGNIIQEKRQKLDTERKIFNELSQLDDFYNKLNPYLKNKIFELLPPNPDLPNLYYNLNQIVKSSNYKLESFSLRMPNEKKQKAISIKEVSSDKKEKNNFLNNEIFKNNNEHKSLQKIVVDMDLQGGGYTNLKNILKTFENNLRLFDVISFVYSPEDTDIKLNFNTYFYN